MIELNIHLIEVYYQNIVEKQWSPQTVKNKLAYMKRNEMYIEHLAMHCANEKYKVNKHAGMLDG
tara:strand:+ start:545 stop:736 length:192 start_codon:yes stop_codon:yes gene_type:complete